MVTAHYLIESDALVYINPALILTSRRENYPPYWTGRIFIQQMLSREPTRRCHVYDGNFIFYDAARKERAGYHP